MSDRWRNRPPQAQMAYWRMYALAKSYLLLFLSKSATTSKEQQGIQSHVLPLLCLGGILNDLYVIYVYV